ncbi:hypothetical protein JMJ77_0004877, partial [Colletotrichum scovillei]
MFACLWSVMRIQEFQSHFNASLTNSTHLNVPPRH